MIAFSLIITTTLLPQKKSPINKQQDRQIDEVNEEADTEQKVNKVLPKIQRPTFVIKTI